MTTDPVARAELHALRASLDEMRVQIQELEYMLRPNGRLVTAVLQARLEGAAAVVIRLAELEARMRSAEERLEHAERSR